jgi:hypothetical protein
LTPQLQKRKILVFYGKENSKSIGNKFLYKQLISDFCKVEIKLHTGMETAGFFDKSV